MLMFLCVFILWNCDIFVTKLCKIHSPSVYVLDNSRAIAPCYWFWSWAMFMVLCSFYTLKLRYLCRNLCKIHSASVDVLDNSREIAPCYLFWSRAMLMFLWIFILWNLDIFVTNCAKYIPRPYIYWIIQRQSPHAIGFDFEQCSWFCAVHTLKLRYVCRKLCKIHSASVDLLDNSRQIAPCYLFWFRAMLMFLCIFILWNLDIFVTNCAKYIPRPYIYWIIQRQSPHAIGFDFEQCSCFCAVYTLKLRDVCRKLCKIHSASVDVLDNSRAIAPCYLFWSRSNVYVFVQFLYSEIAISLATESVQNTFRVRRCTG